MHELFGTGTELDIIGRLFDAIIESLSYNLDLNPGLLILK